MLAMKYGFFWLKLCHLSVLSGMRLSSTGQCARLRSPRPTTSPREWATRASSSRLIEGSIWTLRSGLKYSTGNVELLGKELGRVGHDGGAAGEKEARGSRTALLAAVKLHGLVDLDVQPGHELAGDLGNGRLVRVFRLFVGAAQADEAFLDLELFGHLELQLGFIGEVLGDGVGARD